MNNVNIPILKEIKRRRMYIFLLTNIFILITSLIMLYILYNFATSIPKNILGLELYNKRVLDAYFYAGITAIILFILINTILLFFKRNIGYHNLNTLNKNQIDEINKVLPKKLPSIFKSLNFYKHNFKSIYSLMEDNTNNDLLTFNQNSHIYITKYVIFINRGGNFQILAVSDIVKITIEPLSKYLVRHSSGKAIIKFILVNNKVISVQYSLIDNIYDFNKFISENVPTSVIIKNEYLESLIPKY